MLVSIRTARLGIRYPINEVIMSSKKKLGQVRLENISSALAIKKCPICKKEVVDKKCFPFCSLRCSELDMYNWFSNSYSVPAYELDDVEKEELIKFLEEDERLKD